MALKQFIVDAFESGPFTGNPAAVVPLEYWLADEVMLKIAAENNLSETAFVLKCQGGYELRWFTPTVEIDLCGHATLATAHVLFNETNVDDVRLDFLSKSGVLRVERDSGELRMRLPLVATQPIDSPSGLLEALGLGEAEVFCADAHRIVVVSNESIVRELEVNFVALRGLPIQLAIVTAPGDRSDFVSRVFAPAVGIDEDPATGAAHSPLSYYWGRRLKREDLTAEQVSKRGGSLRTRYVEGADCVELWGTCRTFSRGEIDLG